SNQFVFTMDGTNGAIYTNLTTNNITRQNTAPAPWGPAIFGSTVDNLNILECSFSGDDSRTNNLPDTNNLSGRTPDGLVWDEGTGGNWFIGRSVITNYGLEAVCWYAGPAAAAQNTFASAVNSPSTCAFNDDEINGYDGVTGSPQDLSYAFVGNVVTGGRQGVFGAYSNPNALTNVAYLVVSGNSVSLLPWATNDTFGAAALVTATLVDRLDVAGNTLVSADMPIRVVGGFTNAIILQNNFAGAKLCGIDDESLVDGQVASSLVLKNTISCGTGGTVSGVTNVPPFHLQAPYVDGPRWFLIQNTYLDTSTNGPVNPVWFATLLHTNGLPVQYQP
ncbi:MAG TPA: hypothetical protein VN829_00070, partial [Dongiaceae bacterium]|nr:hypothetical protein [Dongiaceae bacterium]